MTNSQKYEEVLKLAEHRQSLLTKDLQQQKAKYTVLQEELDLLQKTHIAMEQIESSVRGAFTKQICDLVSYGISLVFEEKLEFKINYAIRANAPVVDFSVVSEHGETEVWGAHGGGLVNVVSFLLKLILLIHARPHLRRIMFLDETFHFANRRLPNVALLLQELSEKLDITFVLISDNELLLDIANVVYSVEKKNGISNLILRRNNKTFVEE